MKQALRQDEEATVLTEQANEIQDKIQSIVKNTTNLILAYNIQDTSTQQELRLIATWYIKFPVDRIHWPKNVAASYHPLWNQMEHLDATINKTIGIAEGGKQLTKCINARTKTGAIERAAAKAQFIIKTGQEFLAAYEREGTTEAIEGLRNKISNLQAQQKQLIPLMRQANSQYLTNKKNERKAQLQEEAEALRNGEFWRCSEKTLKKVFHPPFKQNYLAAVSERWRAALYTEIRPESYRSRGGYKRIRIAGTGRGYLCGIDDNGDEWGYIVDLRAFIETDDYGYKKYNATVEEAMACVFNIPHMYIYRCTRQGDLLFSPEEPRYKTEVKCPLCDSEWENLEKELCATCGYSGKPFLFQAVEFTPCTNGVCEIRESHRLESPSLERDGNWFRSSDPIRVSHTSHSDVLLPPGTYRLYMPKNRNID